MATSDAILGVGNTLLSLLSRGLDPLVAANQVFLSTPSDFKNFTPKQAIVTIFLYHVGVHGEMRNAQRNTVGGDGGRPLLPLELRFLVTPWTQHVSDSYRIVGAITQLLNDNSVLHFDELAATSSDDIWAPDDTVELILESLPVEDLYDIWAPTDLPYRLSLTYLARVIGIDSLISTRAPPVAMATFAR